MPIHKIEVSEYECSHCGYKWINRVNGKDGPMPQRCAKCKRPNWDKGYNENPITPEETGLRMRVKGLRELYIWKGTLSPGLHSHFGGYWDFGGGKDNHKYLDVSWDDVAEKWPEDLAQKFLSVEPRPTIQELRQVIYPKGLPLPPVDSQSFNRRYGWVPNPDRPGWLKYNGKEYVNLRKQEALKRIEAMKQVIKSRKKVTANPSA
jgi:hypothetical protein